MFGVSHNTLSPNPGREGLGSTVKLRRILKSCSGLMLHQGASVHI